MDRLDSRRAKVAIISAQLQTLGRIILGCQCHASAGRERVHGISSTSVGTDRFARAPKSAAWRQQETLGWMFNLQEAKPMLGIY